jgi:hypothetical protein
MSWIYENMEIEKLSDFPDNTHGFVYRIIHLPTGKAYIGKKVLEFARKVKLTKKELAENIGGVGRRPAYKLSIKESDWKTYWGSNKYLKEVMKNEPLENFERRIIVCAPSKKLLTYYEVKYQMVYQVLENPNEFYNDSILGKFFTRDFDV